MNNNDNFMDEFNQLMKKYNMNTFCFFGQEDDDSDEYYATYEISNLIMMKIISMILFNYTDFEATRDVIISDVLKYIDPLRITCSKNSNGEYEEIPFIPSVFLED